MGKYGVIMVLVAVALVLVSCIEYEEELRLGEDGSGVLKVTYAISKKVIEKMEKMTEEHPIAKKMLILMNEEEIKKRLKDKEGIELIEFKKEEKKGKIHFSITIKFDKWKRIAKGTRLGQAKFKKRNDGSFIYERTSDIINAIKGLVPGAPGMPGVAGMPGMPGREGNAGSEESKEPERDEKAEKPEKEATEETKPAPEKTEKDEPGVEEAEKLAEELEKEAKKAKEAIEKEPGKEMEEMMRKDIEITAKLIDVLSKEMPMKFEFKLTLPKEIAESNAKETDKKNAIWEFEIKDLVELITAPPDMKMTAKTKK